MKQKKVLTTWLIANHEKAKKLLAYNHMMFAYGSIFEREDEEIGSNEALKWGTEAIDFGNNGWWPLKYYKFVEPSKLGVLEDYLTGEKLKFARQHGIYVMFVKPIDYKLSGPIEGYESI